MTQFRWPSWGVGKTSNTRLILCTLNGSVTFGNVNSLKTKKYNLKQHKKLKYETKINTS
jgi:hypothetical protein